ncbi:Tyrosine-protein phosphatase Lar-like [Oopsacas minuta]|uniref:protein-tyrosine-phosphatase n=1 Tax=Oopsacas minuta TaxID=111878 RepID=A0AAV7JK42_9METZ|nr:Tyrosine-protein phosphatase Lar-like [Oopsacas minuta]
MPCFCCFCCCCRSKKTLGKKARKNRKNAKKLRESRNVSEDAPIRYNQPPSHPEIPPVPLGRVNSVKLSDGGEPGMEYETLESAQKSGPNVIKLSVTYANKNVWLNPYNKEEFITYLHQQLRGKKIGLVKEFQSLAVSRFRYASDEAKSMYNRKKNINANFIPYDMTRLILKKDCAYINASVIPGYYRDVNYVVAQYPIVTAQASTLGDFWEMVWQENIRCIVSLTAEIDPEKGAYWPKERNSDQVFASIVKVKFTFKTVYEFSTHRTFIVSLEEVDNKKSFILHQIEIKADIIEQEPPCIYPIILSLVDQINEIMSDKEKNAKLCFVSKNSNSIIGILITLFESMKAIKDRSPFSVYEIINSLLDHRIGLITQFVHYQLIYISILEHLQALQPISIQDLVKVDVGEIDPESDVTNSVTIEYEKVDVFCNLAYFTKQQTIANSNLTKGQVMHTYPYDDNIVCMQDSPTGQNYLNASYIHMECGGAPVIAAVHPSANTLNEFFWMLITSQVKIVFVLAKEAEITHMSGGFIKAINYWAPSLYNKTVRNFSVIGSKPVQTEGMLKYDVTVAYDEPTKQRIQHQFQLFVYDDWDKNDLPISNKKCIEAMAYIQSFRTGVTGDRPVVLQSINGSTKIGIMLAAINGCSQIQGGQDLDLPWVVKNLRNQRMGMICCKEEYQKCYQLLKEFSIMKLTPPK